MIKTFNDLLDKLGDRPPLRLVVVGAEEEAVVAAIRRAVEKDLIIPTTVSLNPNFSVDFVSENHFAPDPGSAAKLGVELVKSGKADLLMKGSLPTAEVLHPVIDKSGGLLIPGRRLSHIAVLELPGRGRLTLISDAAVNIQPDLEAKVDIINNAVEIADVLGYIPPRVALLSALETVNPKIPSSVDADSIKKLSNGGCFGKAVVSGPLALDNALFPEAVSVKHISNDPVAGQADILVVPELVSGNLLYKSLSLVAGYPTAGIVNGAKVPIILTSRADKPETKINSIILGCYLRHFHK